MKLKSLLFLVCFSLFTNLFADTIHQHPMAKKEDAKLSKQGAKSLNACAIYVVNNTFQNMHVYGTFEDGYGISFDVYPFESTHFIDMFYYGYCHPGMFITVTSPDRVLYSQYTYTGGVVPYY